MLMNSFGLDSARLSVERSQQHRRVGRERWRRRSGCLDAAEVVERFSRISATHRLRFRSRGSKQVGQPVVAASRPPGRLSSATAKSQKAGGDAGLQAGLPAPRRRLRRCGSLLFIGSQLLSFQLRPSCIQIIDDLLRFLYFPIRLVKAPAIAHDFRILQHRSFRFERLLRLRDALLHRFVLASIEIRELLLC
jgi:hypothetical protein